MEQEKTNTDFSIRASAFELHLASLPASSEQSIKIRKRNQKETLRFIERNCLTTLKGLARAAPRLSTLDASGNRVTGVEVEGDRYSEGCLPRTLATLRLSGNDLSGLRALTGLFRSRNEGGGGEAESSSERAGADSESESSSSNSSSPSSLLPLLSTLDLSHCSISDAGTLLALLQSLPSLKALYLQGNPFWESIGAASNNNGGGVGGRLAVLAAAPLCTYLNDSPVFGDERAAADTFRESAGSLEAARDARGRFLESAALEAERTTRLLERPPRFVRLVEEEEGDEEPDVRSDDEEEEKENEEMEKECCQAKENAEGGAAAAATASEAVLEEGEEAEA